MDHGELAACLRSWRDRLTPAEVGLPAGAQRRAPGLRREEVAALAGLSVDYLARLEQGRASNPSASVLGPLARALRLTDDERAHLFRAAGLVDHTTGQISRHITPGVQRILDRLGDVAVTVIDPAWEIVAANPLAMALVGNPFNGERDVNVARDLFLRRKPDRAQRQPAQTERFENEIVADLHAATSRYPHDERLHGVIAELRRESPRFAELWEERPVAVRVSEHKVLEHPEVGTITVDCDTLTVQASDLRIVVYTARPGSPDADKLALLSAIGSQTFGEHSAIGDACPTPGVTIPRYAEQPAE
ncbi:MAG: helix-turn-helix transcriptional regulator [Patulibacter sp.]|nr:helix-turn-helix transcriptional regulator [Patulibacter sp.]